MFVASPSRPFGRKDPPAPLPNSKTTFEPPLKRELANRLFLICSVFLGFTWLVSLIATLDFTRGPPLGVLGHLLATSLTALLALLIGAAPLLILRGHAVSETYTTYPTRAETFSARISSTRTWRTLGYFAASGFSLTLLHVVYLNFSEWEDSRLSMLSPTRRNSTRLNERFFYLAFFNASLGLVYASRDIIRQREIVRWTRPDDQNSVPLTSTPTSKIIQGVFSVLNIKAVVSTSLITFIHVLLFPICYHLLRPLALPMLRNLPLISGFMKPLLHGFGRTWMVDVPWRRLLTLGFKTTLGWELVETGFDYWVGKPIFVSQKAPNPNQALVAGLHSRHSYFKRHAYLELFALATSQSSTASARRTALFTDTKTSPTLWNAVLRELLLTLGRDYQCLLRRGKPPPPTPAAPQPSVTPRTPKVQPLPLIRQAITKPSPRSLFDSFMSDRATTETTTSTAISPKPTNVPNVFLPSSPSTPRLAKHTPALVEAKPIEVATRVESKATSVNQKIRASKIAALVSVLAWAERMLPQQWHVKEWWTNVSIERQAQACVPEAALDIIGIDALSHFTAASLKEDSLGTVQRDIPRILEALLSFLAEAEAYQAELERKVPVGHANNNVALEGLMRAQDVACAMEVVLPVVHALRAGVVLIAKTFDNRLNVYKFPPVTAARLQSFMDYM